MLCLFILQWWLTVFNIFGIKICYDFPFKGISSVAQFVTLNIYLWHPSFGCLQIFPKITIELTLKMGGRVLIATHLDQSNYLANQQHRCEALLCHLPASAKCTEMLGQNHFAAPN
jgi:hypothetical protein